MFALPVIVTAPGPSLTSAFAPNARTPLSVTEQPASTASVPYVAPTVMAPARVTPLPLASRNAPVLSFRYPVPPIVSPSASVVTPFASLYSSAAPALTVVAPAVVPSALICDACRMPSLTVMAPVNVLIPARFSVPLRSFRAAVLPATTELTVSVPPPAVRAMLGDGLAE